MSSTLSEDDIEKLFSGAPQYFARSEAHFPGAPHPSVAFPFNEELEIRDLTDHVQIEDMAWSGVTAWPHLTRDLNLDPAARKSFERHAKAHFHVRTRERPNMLSMQGLEKGTMGYQAALELPVGDSLEEEQFGFESVGTKARAVVDARKRMMSAEGHLHRLPEVEVMDRLRRNGDVYRKNDMRKRPTIETYTELFHSLMRPRDPVIDKNDHYSLINQINSLVKCLATSNVWIDLSRVEWRIRLGQILWGQTDGDELDDDTEIHDATNAAERAEERYWLLVQVLLSTELLIRLDAITADENSYNAFRPADGAYFERQANTSVKWSILLARSWLENIEVVKEEVVQKGIGKNLRPGSGWLASLVSKMVLKHSHDQETQKSTHHYTIQGRHGVRQVDGLTHFARKIQWPGIYSYESRISENAQDSVRSSSSTLATPNTTGTKSSSRSSYFGAWDVTSHHHHGQGHRVQAQRRKMAAALHASGWLSKSYVFALLLPGEALSHFLMATLLENDSEALETLGSFANLCGGFVYRGKSFWSTLCIVGRVLAAGQGATECMGWISTDVVPEDTKDGWLNIESEDVPEDLTRLGRKARIWGKKRVEKESSILGDGNENTVLPADFVVPRENSYSTPPPSITIALQTFKLLRSVENVHPSPLSELTGTPMTESPRAPDLPTHPAKFIFRVSLDGQSPEEIAFTLAYDVSFVTAHPCAPSRRVRIMKSPESPTIQQIDVSGAKEFGRASRSAHRAGHPLHKYYDYTVVHLSELIRRRQQSLADLINPDPTKKAVSRSGDKRVLVIDCITNYADQPESPMSPVLERMNSGGSTSSLALVESWGNLPGRMHLEYRKSQYGSDMEILVRALCAQKGWNALISRKKRGCLACAIREAGALGWRVIIRV
ncbi:unnamed protein product [Clonostachys byssicola]|uniref:Uncharacterized protein n=1 Tax=Clonostachys byssicola TaxID=160290 RepID=A0A9N9UP58_9HYPO|nr:unnamed protein product [Clonostachys byssicola]